MIIINVITSNNKWYNYIKDPINYVSRKVKKLNKKEKVFSRKTIYCTLLLSGNKEIKNLNKRFRKKDKSTDVLSFPFQTKKEFKNLLKKEREVYLGDIIINLNKIRNKNIRYFKSEFDRLWIHGLVHLFGHDHKKKKDFIIMSHIEKKYINLINAK